MTTKMNYAVLVYQAGIANVYACDTLNLAYQPHRQAKRLLQADFRACENFARGIAAAGIPVASAYCTMAGDITSQPWSDDLAEAPFSDKFAPVWSGVVNPAVGMTPSDELA